MGLLWLCALPQWWLYEMRKRDLSRLCHQTVAQHYGPHQVRIPHSEASCLPASGQTNLLPYKLPSQRRFSCHSRKRNRTQVFLILLSGVLPLYCLPSGSDSGDTYPPGGLKDSGKYPVQCSSHRTSQNYSHFSSELRFCPGQQLQKTTKQVLCPMLQS